MSVWLMVMAWDINWISSSINFFVNMNLMEKYIKQLLSVIDTKNSYKRYIASINILSKKRIHI